MEKDYSKMTVAQLKAVCTERGLATTPAKKSDLLARIMQDVVAKAKDDDDEPEADEEEQMLEGDDVGAAEPDDALLNETEENGAETPADTNGADTEAKDGDATTETKDEEKKDEEKKDEKKLADSEISKLPKPAGMSTKIDRQKIGLPDGVPDLPSYHSIQEARISETRVRTVIVYPLDVNDMSSSSLQDIFSKSEHFMLKYVLNGDKVMKGFVEMHFDTRAHANEASEALAGLSLSNELTVRQLAANEAGTAYKTAVIDAIKPHLSHQVKKASDDYDTRIVYVHNMPEDTDDAKVAETFPEAKSCMTAIDDDGKNKGFAYLSFETEEETDACVKKHAEVTMGDNRVCVFQIKDLKAAAGIDTKRPFHRRGGANRNSLPQRGGKGGQPQGRPSHIHPPPSRRGHPIGRAGYPMRGGGIDRGAMRGGRGGRGGGVPSLMNMPRPGGFEGARGYGGYDRPQVPRYMQGSDYDYGYLQFQERKRRAAEAGFMDMGGQPWKMGRGAPGGRYGGGGWGGRW